MGTIERMKIRRDQAVGKERPYERFLATPTVCSILFVFVQAANFTDDVTLAQ